jgi:hypothetical protein
MARKRKPRKEFALVNTKREFARKGCRYVTTTVASGRPLGNLPAKFSSWKLGFGWHEIYETVVDEKHSGPARYELRESQTMRITKIVSKENS